MNTADLQVIPSSSQASATLGAQGITRCTRRAILTGAPRPRERRFRFVDHPRRRGRSLPDPVGGPSAQYGECVPAPTRSDEELLRRTSENPCSRSFGTPDVGDGRRAEAVYAATELGLL